MKIKKIARAGTLQSNDCFITIRPAEKLDIKLESPVKFEFEDQIINVVKKTLENEKIENVCVEIEDRGALDCTIQARLITAIRRSK